MDISAYIPFIEQCFEGRACTLEDVPGGRSYDIKAKVNCGGKDYIVKVIEGNSGREEYNPDRVAWYQVLSRIHSEEPGILGPLRYGVVNNHVVTLTEWIRGTQLNDLFVSSPELRILLGRRVGAMLHKLHHQEFVDRLIREKNVRIVPKVMERISRLEDEIRSCGICFRGMDRALDYLHENSGLVSEERACVVHDDVRPENFIFSDGNVYMFDFDSGTISDSFADFTYLTTVSGFGDRKFSYAVISSCFEEGIPEGFWEANLYFSIIKLLDYAVYKYHKSGEMIGGQADNYIRIFDDYTNPVPDWWKLADELYCGRTM